MTLSAPLRLFFVILAIVLFAIFTIIVLDDQTKHHALAWLGGGLISFSAAHI